MKKRFLVLIVFVVLVALPASAQVKWQLVWSDEFDYNGLPDPAKSPTKSTGRKSEVKVKQVRFMRIS